MTNEETTPGAKVTEATTPQQASEIAHRRWGIEHSLWTQRMLTRLAQSESTTKWFPTTWFAEQGRLRLETVLAPMVSLAETPPTGEPDAGNPHVRFGGRGGANHAIPTPIIRLTVK